jgi:pyruvate dehydrogenase (quinone)
MPSTDADQFADTLAAHPQELLSDYSLCCERKSGANHMRRDAETAIRVSVGKRGVSVAVIPGDIALQQAVDAPPPKRGVLLPPQPVTVPAAAELDRLAALPSGDGAFQPQTKRFVS